MAKLIRFFVFVSLMVCSSHAMGVQLANSNKTFYYCTAIESELNGIYIGRSVETNFTAQNDTIKVILYVCTFDAFQKIMRYRNRFERNKIAEELSRRNYQLLYLGVKKPRTNHLQGLIGGFIYETIQSESEDDFSIEILGEKTFHMQYESYSTNTTYKIYFEVPTGCLRERFDAMAA